MSEPTKQDAAPKPSGPVATDPLNPSIKIPVYLGGEGPVPMPEPGDRGDSIEPAKTAEEPAPAVDPAPGQAGDAAPAEPAASEPSPEDKNTSDQVTQPEEQPRDNKGQFIPRSRFNEVNKERKRLAQELEQLKAQQNATQKAEEGEYDFEAKEKEYADLVLDGKIEDAVKLRAEIRAAEQAAYIKAAQKVTVETTQQLTAKERLEQVSSKYEQALPQFDPEDDENFNEELLSDVQAFYVGSLQTNNQRDPAEAFEAAVKKALRLHGIPDPFDSPASTSAPAPAAASAEPPRTPQKRVEAIVKQPPSLSGIGTSGASETPATINVKDISDKDLFALPEATRRRLRGDIL